VAAEGVAEKEKAENDEKQGRKADFCQLCTRFVSCSENEICSYL